MLKFKEYLVYFIKHFGGLKNLDNLEIQFEKGRFEVTYDMLLVSNKLRCQYYNQVVF